MQVSAADTCAAYSDNNVRRAFNLRLGHVFIANELRTSETGIVIRKNRRLHFYLSPTYFMRTSQTRLLATGEAASANGMRPPLRGRGSVTHGRRFVAHVIPLDLCRVPSLFHTSHLRKI